MLGKAGQHTQGNGKQSSVGLGCAPIETALVDPLAEPDEVGVVPDGRELLLGVEVGSECQRRSVPWKLACMQLWRLHCFTARKLASIVFARAPVHLHDVHLRGFTWASHRAVAAHETRADTRLEGTGRFRYQASARQPLRPQRPRPTRRLARCHRSALYTGGGVVWRHPGGGACGVGRGSGKGARAGKLRTKKDTQARPPATAGYCWLRSACETRMPDY